MKNPLKWFAEGINFIVFLPIEVLEQVGIISEPTKYKISESYFGKIFSGIVTLISLVSAIVGIVVGWEQFLKIIEGLR